MRPWPFTRRVSRAGTIRSWQLGQLYVRDIDGFPHTLCYGVPFSPQFEQSPHVPEKDLNDLRDLNDDEPAPGWSSRGSLPLVPSVLFRVSRRPYSGNRLWVPSQNGFDAACLQQHKA